MLDVRLGFEKKRNPFLWFYAGAMWTWAGDAFFKGSIPAMTVFLTGFVLLVILDFVSFEIGKEAKRNA